MNSTAGNDDLPIAEGSGDVFADLGFADPGLARAKAGLALHIGETIRRRGWTQAKAAEVMGIDPPKVSALTRGRLSDFSLDRLVTYLDRLGQTVEFRFGVKPRGKGSSGPSRKTAATAGRKPNAKAGPTARKKAAGPVPAE